MIHESKKILNVLENKIELLCNSESKPLMQSQQAHELAKDALNQVKLNLLSSQFKSEAQEIEYFKCVQPAIASHAIYYSLLHRYYLKLSGFCNDKQIKNLCKKNSCNIDNYFIENQTFITYYKSGNCELDNYYFLRSRSNASQLLDECLVFIDPLCSTGYDLIAARFLAYSKLNSFYMNEVKQLKVRQKNPYIIITPENKNNVVWTDKKIGLIELIYALHEAGCINNGKCELDEIAKAIEIGFNVQLGNIYTS